MLARGARCRRRRVPAPLPAPALRRPAAARRARDGVRLPAARDRARRADDRARRDDPGARAARPCASCATRTASRRSTSPTISPSSPARRPGRGDVRRTDRRERARATRCFARRAIRTRGGCSRRSPTSSSRRRARRRSPATRRRRRRPAGCSFAPRCPFAVERADGVAARRVEVRDAGHTRALHPAARTRGGSVARRRAARQRAARRRRRAVAVAVLRRVAASHGAGAGRCCDVDLARVEPRAMRRARRRVRLRQDHARPLHRRPARDLRRRDRASTAQPLAARARATAAASAPAALQYVFQNPYASLNPRKRSGEIVAPAAARSSASTAATAEPRRGERSSGCALARRCSPRYPRRALRRRAPAGRDRARAGGRPDAARLRRDHLRARRLRPGRDHRPARRLQRELRLGLLFVTHDLALVRTIADRVAVLSGGAIVEAGRVDDVLDRPQEPTRARCSPTRRASRPRSPSRRDERAREGRRPRRPGL